MEVDTWMTKADVEYVRKAVAFYESINTNYIRDDGHTRVCRLSEEKQCTFLGYKGIKATPVCMHGEQVALLEDSDNYILRKKDCVFGT